MFAELVATMLEHGRDVQAGGLDECGLPRVDASLATACFDAALVNPSGLISQS